MKKNIVGTRRYLRRLCWLNFDAEIKKLGTKQQKILVNKQTHTRTYSCYGKLTNKITELPGNHHHTK